MLTHVGTKIIETKRLLLREYTFDDFNALYEIMSDPETMQHYPEPFDEERTGHWIEWNLENYAKYGFGLWAVVLKETENSLGTVASHCRTSMVKCCRR